MAGNAIIGALRAVLGIDTAQFETGLKSAQSHLSGFGAGVAKAGAAAATAFAAAGIAVGVALKHAVDEADKFGKMSQKFGVPVEELSKLRLAASLSDVSMETLGKTLGKLSVNMIDAAAKPTAEAAASFKALGVQVQNSDGTLKSSTDVLGAVAGKFSDMKDGAEKTGIAMKLFGKTGAELIPLLNSGKDGLAAMMKEAQDLGLTIDKQTAKSAEAFNDNLTRLGYVTKGITTQIASGMVPALEQLSDGMVRAAKSGEGFKGLGESIGNALLGAFNIAERLGLMWQRLGVEWSAFTKLFSTMPFTEAWSKAWADFQTAGNATANIMAELTRKQNDATVAIGTTGGAATGLSQALGNLNLKALGGKTALDKFLESSAKSTAATFAQAQTFGMAAGTTAHFTTVAQGLAAALSTGLPITEAMRASIMAAGEEARLAGMKLAGMQLTAANMTPWETFQQSLRNNQILFDSGAISADTFARANERAAEAVNMTWASASTSIGGSFTEIGQTMAGMSDNFGRLAKIGQAIGASIAFVNAYVAASQALATAIFPANIALAAGVLAKGMGMVAAIRSASIQSAAMGGAFRVGGGMGGGDSKLVQMALEPGELVEVSSNREGGYKSGGNGKSVNINLQGDNFSAKAVRALIEQINEAVGDGMQLNIKSGLDHLGYTRGA